MLSLEQRVLLPFVPDVTGLDVVDFGCGTGRWLAALEHSGPRSLVGVDSSLEMLEVAKNKLGSTAILVNTNCEGIVLPEASADVIFCSFLASYLEDIPRFLKSVRSTLRTRGCMFLTDIHPGTAAKLSWKRGAPLKDRFQEIQTVQRNLETIVQFCEQADLEVEICLQPRFGGPERIIFNGAGKGGYFDEIKEYPAIYVLKLRPRSTCESEGHHFTLSGARLAIGPDLSTYGDLQCANSRVVYLRDESGMHLTPRVRKNHVDLSGYLILPGLVNAHDHLEFALYPRLGGSSYKNYVQWAEEIYRPNDSPVREQRQVPREVRLWWGGIRNLLSGVTTVCHHNPYEPGVFGEDFAVRVVADFGWAHSLAMDAEVVLKKKKTPAGQPFLVHLGEGTDGRSAGEIFELQRSGALDNHTILIHGLALNHAGRSTVRDANAGLVWCPSSNIFLFGKTLTSEELEDLPRVALGSDSPLTAIGDLLDELRLARLTTGVPTRDLYKFVTQSAARILCLRHGEGTLGIGSRADLMAVRDTGADPADELASLSFAQVELVILGGRVQLASAEMMKRLPTDMTAGLQPLRVEETARWIRAPLGWLFAEATRHLGEEIRLGGKRVSLGG